MRPSLLISLALLLASCFPARELRRPAFDGEKAARYHVLITARQAEITGVMVVKRVPGGWRGSLINEFGVKAFDFIAEGGRCRLLNTIAFLDKWYIRRAIAADLSFLCGTGKDDGKRLAERRDDGVILLRDERHGIKYVFQPVE
jgi:hypothetical protein